MFDSKFFDRYYYGQKLSFSKLSKLTGKNSTTIFYYFKKLGLKPIKHDQWNKGLNCFTDKRILSGKNHPKWKNASKYLIEFKLKRAEMIKSKKKCKCGKNAFVLHHIDKNTENNNDNNLLPLCLSCHTILHNKERGVFMIKRKCLFCGNEFTIKSNRKSKQKCCSSVCGSKYNYHIGKTSLRHNHKGKTIYNKMCKYCNKEFQTYRKLQRCCSVSCRSKAIHLNLGHSLKNM